MAAHRTLSLNGVLWTFPFLPSISVRADPSKCYSNYKQYYDFTTVFGIINNYYKLVCIIFNTEEKVMPQLENLEIILHKSMRMKFKQQCVNGELSQ